MEGDEVVAINFEPENIDISCPKMWELIASGLTKGIFQLETPLGQTTAKACKPYGVEELSDVMSIIRPGCISGDTLISTGENTKTLMRELYKKGKGQKQRRILSYDSERGLFRNLVKDLIYSGEKLVYRVNYQLNKLYEASIKQYGHIHNLECTDDHKLLTQDGWKPLSDIQPGELIAIILHHTKKLDWAVYTGKTPLCIKDTYDIQMQAPHHNFVAGSTLVHNCGDAELDGKTLKQRYIDRKNGNESPAPLHAKLGDLLESTYNVGIYQESYLLISKKLAGFTGTEAVSFLKSIAKKRVDLMTLFKDKFIKGCMKHSNLSEEDATNIFDIMEAGQRYAFNKCLAHNTEVITDQGIKFIEDVEVGDYVKNHRGEYLLVKDKMNQGKQHCLNVTLTNGYKITCTINHKLLCSDGGIKCLYEIISEGNQIVTSDGNFNIKTAVFTDEKIKTFDIEVDSPDHLFLANGIATSNSHSLSYAIDALIFSAYQKSHFPRAFFLAELVYAGNIEEISDVLNDALNFKVKVCKPDLRLMNDEFILSDRCIQYGLGRVRGVGVSKLAKLKAALTKSPGEMTWTELMMALSKTSSDAAFALIYGGALDFTLLTRGRMSFELGIFNRLTETQQVYVSKSQSLNTAVSDMLAMGSGRATPSANKISLKKVELAYNELQNPPKTLRDTPNQLFDWELRYLGYAFTTPEFDESLSNCTCEDFINGKVLKEYLIGANIIRIKVIETKGKQPGQEMAFIDIKDSTNKISAVAFPQVWLENQQRLFEGNKVMFFGTRGTGKRRDSFLISRVMQL